MTAMDQLEALNPVPNHRGNPGPVHDGGPRRLMRRSAAVLAIAAALVVFGALSLRGTGGDGGEVNVAVGAQPTPEDVAIIDLESGFFAVARPFAGTLDTTGPVTDSASRNTIPVYREPNGQARTLLYENSVLGVDREFPLVNESGAGGALVLRVLARTEDAEWLKVQAPILPHDRFVWVRSEGFDLHRSPERIEIDLAQEGQLQVLAGDNVLLTSDIVHGRPGRETPTHLTYIENGVPGELLEPFYGDAVLTMASFSEVLGSFGSAGGLPVNYLHGTTNPELMGQRVSSGEIRIPDETLRELIDLTGPGTPVILFDSHRNGATREDIVNRTATLARTVPFTQARDGAALPLAESRKLWQWCPLPDGAPLCRVEG